MVKRYKNIKPFVVGMGLAGNRHLDAQLKLEIKTGVYNIHPEKTKHLRKRPDVIVFNNFKDGLKWSNLVHVCTPDDKHTEYVALAIKNGKAVFCEKAFTTNLKDALYLQDLAHKYNATLIIAQNYRLTPTFAETKKRVLEGKLGTITHIETTYFHDKTEYQKRYPSQNFLYIGGSHAVDLACWTVGEPIVSVKVTSVNMLSYQITVKFSSGIPGQIILDATLPQSVNGTDLKVFGEKGKLISHNKIDELIFYKRGRKKPQSIKLQNSTTFTTAREVKIVDDYLSGKLTSHWPLPEVDEALNLIRVLNAIQKASFSGRNESVYYGKPNQN